MKRRVHSSSATPGARRVRVLRRRQDVASPMVVRGPGAPLWIRMLWGLGFLLIATALFWVLRPVVAVLAASAAIAYVLDPAVDWFENRGFSREMGIGVVFTVLLMFFGVFVLLIVPSFVQQVLLYSEKLGPFVQDLGVQLQPWVAWLSATTGIEWDFDQTVDQLVEGMDRAWPVLQEYAGQIRDWVAGGTQGLLTRGLGIISTLVNLALMPLFVFYLLQDWDRLVQSFSELIPLDWRPRVTRVMTEVDRRLSAFVRGQITVAAIMAVLYSVGLLLVGIDLAIPVGLLSGVLFVVPYLGTMVGIVLAGMLSIMKYGIAMNVIWTMLVFVVVQTIEGYLLTPKRNVAQRGSPTPISLIRSSRSTSNI